MYNHIPSAKHFYHQQIVSQRDDERKMKHNNPGNLLPDQSSAEKNCFITETSFFFQYIPRNQEMNIWNDDIGKTGEIKHFHKMLIVR